MPSVWYFICCISPHWLYVGCQVNTYDLFPLGKIVWDDSRTRLEIIVVSVTEPRLLQLFSGAGLTSAAAAAAAAKSLQSFPTLCDPIDGSPPGSLVPGILQAITLEWVAISFSNAWKWKVKMKSLSGVQLLATPWTAAYQGPPFMWFSRQEYWSGVPLPSPGLITEPLLILQLKYEATVCRPVAFFIFTSPVPLSAKLLLLTAQLCATLGNPMNCNTLGFPVLHCLPELA